jgi:tetratricopeptide (TPR) repeat protein
MYRKGSSLIQSREALLLSVFISILTFSNTTYGRVASKEPKGIVPQASILLSLSDEEQSTVEQIDQKIKVKRATLLKTQKSDAAKYTSLYDDIVELTISRNNYLKEMERADDIDSDKTCGLALKYAEVEFIKTQYYKTPFNDNVAKTLQNTAILYEQCYPPMAEKYLRSTLKIKEHIYTKNSIEVAKSHDFLGDFYRVYMTNFEKSIKEYREAKRIREKLYGTRDPRITENYKSLAFSLYYHGDKVNQAEKLLLDSIVIHKNSPPDKKHPLYLAYMDLGIFYSINGKYDKSTLYLQKALKAFDGKIDRRYIAILENLSQGYLNQGDFDNALKFGEEAYGVSREFYGKSTHPHVLESLSRILEIKDRISRLHK